MPPCIRLPMKLTLLPGYVSMLMGEGRGGGGKIAILSNMYLKTLPLIPFHQRLCRKTSNPSFRTSDAQHSEIRNPGKWHYLTEFWIPARGPFYGAWPG